MKTIRPLITYGLFPTVFILAMIAAMWAIENDYSGGAILASITFLTAFIIVIFERINPEFGQWNKNHNDVKTDALHAIVSMIFIPQVLEGLLAALLVTVAIQLSAITGFSLWPHHWPLMIQVVLAMVISQFGEYWVHRSMHTVPFLWRFHATHHSPKRLYWLNAARFHPFDTIASYSIAIIPLLILGVNEPTLILMTVWISVHGLFQHCNIHLKLGFLNYIFSMAELHRWHHSLKLEEANTNYGNNIIFWDIVFGTMFYPSEREASQHIGLSDIETFPEDYLGQLASPFKWEEINAPTSVSSDKTIRSTPGKLQ